MVLEYLFPLLIVGQIVLHERVEAGVVRGLLEVAELVDDDEFQALSREKQQVHVQLDVAECGLTGSPARAGSEERVSHGPMVFAHKWKPIVQERVNLSAQDGRVEYIDEGEFLFGRIFRRAFEDQLAFREVISGLALVEYMVQRVVLVKHAEQFALVEVMAEQRLEPVLFLLADFAVLPDPVLVLHHKPVSVFGLRPEWDAQPYGPVSAHPQAHRADTLDFRVNQYTVEIQIHSIIVLPLYFK